MLDLDYGESDEANVSGARAPAFGFAAHNAPLGILFPRGESLPEAYHDGALVALHWAADGSVESHDFIGGFLEDDGGPVRGYPASSRTADVGHERGPMMPRTVKKSSSRGPLKPMRVSDSFRAYVLEQLAAVKGLQPRAMFGGVGLYSVDVFFGILAADVLYLKVDNTNRAAFEAAGMRPLKPYADRPITMSYWQVPVAVLEDADELEVWAKGAIRVAKSSAKKKPRRKA